MNKFYIALLLLSVQAFCLHAFDKRFSTAGFYEIENTGRSVYSLNPGWLFYKGPLSGAESYDFNDSAWDAVSIPHGLELLPEEASGSINYQGEAWYRKHFSITGKEITGKKVFLHFEGIMGKSRIWLNGQLIKENYDSYLPVIMDVTNLLSTQKENIIAVCADNSDDPLLPPGKPQYALDFTYFGGIYRDCFLITHNPVYITDPNYETEIGGGGFFVSYPEVTAKSARVGLKLQVRNASEKAFKGKALFRLKDKSGKIVKEKAATLSITAGRASYVNTQMELDKPDLWFPDSPYLYDMDILISDSKGNVIDGYSRKIGIKKIEYRANEGLFINNKKIEDKLIGVNRHQDFAVIGNALPNSLHWRDAKKLRDAGFRVVRLAHYPHDPAFLDACDEMGLLVILPIAGWQFWNNNPLFAERIYAHIRNMVRRDRNHPCIFIWEPVLNETHFPEEYARKAKQCVDEEYPYNQSLTACDPGSEGSGIYPVIFTHPQSVAKGQKASYNADVLNPAKMYFTREFGDNVDDWNSHNSNSRVHRSWGEVPMLQQAMHYASPEYLFTCLETLYESPGQHIGGTLWHAFDHQRGYHPQPFYGGIMDAFRQPKTSYYMFQSQRPATRYEALPAESGPMVYIANEMTPFSPQDVTVYSNCEEVRLTVFKNGKQYKYLRSENKMKMPSPIIVFKDAFHFMELKALSRANKRDDIYMLAEGLINGKVVASYKRKPALRPDRIQLRIDNNGLDLQADGSDIVTIIAEVVDKEGNVKRLNNNSIFFSIEGEGHILGSNLVDINPAPAHWGSAPILVQATDKAGTIRIKADIYGEGVNAITSGEIEFESKHPVTKQLYDPALLQRKSNRQNAFPVTGNEKDSEIQKLKKEVESLKKKIAAFELKKVEKQQNDFGEKR